MEKEFPLWSGNTIHMYQDLFGWFKLYFCYYIILAYIPIISIKYDIFLEEIERREEYTEKKVKNYIE